MSHFVVAVITKTNSEEELNSVLQPYHEYECTGKKDEYVAPVDVHDKAIRVWETGYDTEEDEKEDNWKSGIRYLRNKETGVETKKEYPDNLFSSFLKEFYHTKGASKEDYDTRIKTGGTLFNERYAHYKLKPEIEKITKTYKETGHSLEEFVKDWYGWEEEGKGKWWDLINDRYCDLTNPNAKWDWWCVGGRYSGRLVAKDNMGVNGEYGGVFDRTPKTEADVPIRGFDGMGITTLKRPVFDQLQLKNLDLDAMEALIEHDQRGYYQKAHVEYDRAKRKGDDDDTARRVSYFQWGKDDKHPLDHTEDEWIKDRIGFSTWALLYDKQWVEKGEMGWFGMSDDKYDSMSWKQQCSAWIRKMIEEKPDHYITMVDCHI